MSALVDPAPVLDEVAALRDLAAEVLTLYGVLAPGAPAGAPLGVPVEVERLDPYPDEALPRIAVFADEQAINGARANGVPVLDITATLIVACLAVDASKSAVVATVDAMIAQIKDALLRSPAITSSVWLIEEVRTSRSFKPQAQRILGEGRVVLTVKIARKTYNPRVTTPLAGVNVSVSAPAAPAPAPAAATLSVTSTLDL